MYVPISASWVIKVMNNIYVQGSCENGGVGKTPREDWKRASESG